MPLKDLFRPPLADRKPWESFHHAWAVYIVDRLNGTVLAPKYECYSEIHIGPQIEVDVATFEDPQEPSSFGLDGSDGGVATLVETYAPPAPPITGEVSFAAPDVVEVQVFRKDGGWKFVAAIELVSPANKDRGESRLTFATKVASYLSNGVSVVVVDVVTDRRANLHEALADLVRLPGSFEWESPTGLSAVSYRMVQRKKQVRLDVWPFPLSVGEALPTVPLWLAADLAVPLELETTFAAACKSHRIA